MKRFAALVAVLAIMALPLTATAGEKCCPSKAKTASVEKKAEEATVKTVSNSSCSASKTTKTASNESCSATAKTASNSSCSSAAKTASNASCSSVAKTASNASCSSVAKTASNTSCSSKAAGLTAGASCSAAQTASYVYCGTGASCGEATAAVGDCCKSSNVVYRVSVDGTETDSFVHADAKAIADKNNTEVHFVVAGTTYPSENDARMALTKAIYDRIGNLTTVAYNVNGETTHCAQTASAKAAACETKTAVMYQVANHTFESQEAADAFKAKVVAAMEGVMLVDATGAKVEGCAVSHCEAAKTAEKVDAKKASTFVVAGKTVADPFEANLIAAQERLRAILSTDA